MKKPMEFLFVSGDAGSANVHLAIAREMRRRGHHVSLAADPKGQAGKIFSSGGEKAFHLNLPDIGNYQAVSIGLDLNASALCHEALNAATSEDCPIFFPADNYFNHADSKWRDVEVGNWCAIDEGHARAIERMRPDLEDRRLRVVGQPLFDELVELLPKRDEIRRNTRERLGVADDERLVIWWSHSFKHLFTGDFQCVLEAVREVAKAEKIAFVPLLHPALDAFHKGFCAEVLERIKSRTASARVISALGCSPNELDIAADVVFAGSLSVEGLKAVVLESMVIRVLDESSRRHFEENLLQKWPYWGDIAAGRSLVVQHWSKAARVLGDALDEEVRKKIQSRWVPPEPSLQRVCDFLEEIARD